MKTEILSPAEREARKSSVKLKERKLSLSLQSEKVGGVVIIYLKGRIVYRDEAVALSQAVAQALEQSRQIILDLQAVTSIDSAGLGELVGLHMWAQASGCSLALSSLSSRIQHLLEITNLTSLFAIYATNEEALRACQPEVA